MGDCGFYAVEQPCQRRSVLRMAQRYEGVPATSAWQQLMDRYYPDEKLAKIYPSMTHTN